MWPHKKNVYAKRAPQLRAPTVPAPATRRAARREVSGPIAPRPVTRLTVPSMFPTRSTFRKGTGAACSTPHPATYRIRRDKALDGARARMQRVTRGDRLSQSERLANELSRIIGP
ncbi:unnamed protein product, partial [Iphiclides podalirius]